MMITQAVASTRGFGFLASISGKYTGTISYTIGAGGAGGVDANNGFNGANSTLSYAGVSLNARGGGLGWYNITTLSAGGTASGGTQNATGGTGQGVSGDTGGGYGGGINGSTGTAGSSAGGIGATPSDFFGLSAALTAAGYSLGTGGSGGGSGSTSVNAMNGSPGTGFGSGGGGAGYYGGNGGKGGYGGGGGGAAGFGAVNMTGGAGGDGFLVLQFNSSTPVVLLSGTSYAIPAGTNTIKAWIAGGGGGGAGSTNSDVTSGGGGGGAGISYYAWS